MSISYWLMKSEPNVWSIDQQKKTGTKGATWDGVRNYQAAKNLKAMKKGDLLSQLFFADRLTKHLVLISLANIAFNHFLFKLNKYY